VLSLKGEKKSERDEKKDNYHLVERSYGSFERSFRLPDTAEEAQIKADFNKGVLRVIVPKRAEAVKAEKKIPIGKVQSRLSKNNRSLRLRWRCLSDWSNVKRRQRCPSLVRSLGIPPRMTVSSGPLRMTPRIPIHPRVMPPDGEKIAVHPDHVAVHVKGRTANCTR
jgi:hypothetical protein